MIEKAMRDKWRLRWQMEREVRRVARELALTPPFGPQVFAGRLVRKGCYIVIEPIDMGRHGLYGQCTAVGDYYYIRYRENAGMGQRELIMWLELAHIVLGHVTPDIEERRFVITPEKEHLAEVWAEAMMAYASALGRGLRPQAATGIGRLIQDLAER